MTDINAITNEQLHAIVAQRLTSTLSSCYRSMISMHIVNWAEQAKKCEGIDYVLAGCPDIADVVWDEPPLPGISHLTRASAIDDMMEKLPLNSLMEFMDEDLIHSTVHTVMQMYRAEMIDTVVQRCTSHENLQLRDIAINQKDLLITVLKDCIS